MAVVGLSSKDLESLKPYVDKAVQRIVGSKEPTVVNSAISLLASGADKRQITDKLRTLHPSLTERAHKLADLIMQIATEYLNSLQEHQQKSAKKRHRGEDSGPPPKKPDSSEPTASPGQLTTMQIKEMMANAQKVIEERKRLLQASGQLPPPGVIIPPPVMMATNLPPVGLVHMPPPPSVPAVALETDKKIKLAQLQAQIQSKIGALKTQISSVDETDATPSKPVPLLLDNEGRAIDVSGKQLLYPQHQPTLKANIRAQKKMDVKSTEKLISGISSVVPVASEESGESKFFDDRLTLPKVKGLERRKKPLKFNDPGKYVAIASRERMQAQLAKLQEEIAEKARKTGISTAARLAKLTGAVGTPLDKSEENIPDLEWWDSMVLEDFENHEDPYDSKIKSESISNLIEHPTQMRCPTDPLENLMMPVFLTKKERKKLRRQNRREAWKEKQERVRLGLDASPAPKVRISNLMRVLGVEAVQDPTKVEAHVRLQMAKRLKSHHDANLSRKLTPEQKKEKKKRKIEEDTSLGVHVSLYRVDCLGNQSKRFKVDTVAKQLHMTGIIAMFREGNVILVEGGPKQQKKYRRLMMHRIKWSEDPVKDRDDVMNKCVLVWEGLVKKRSFNDLKFKMFKTEEMVREYFKKYGVQHYWDLVLSGTVLESIADL